jgi:hypothetical protein
MNQSILFHHNSKTPHNVLHHSQDLHRPSCPRHDPNTQPWFLRCLFMRVVLRFPVSPPPTNSRSERTPQTLGPQQGRGPRRCGILVPAVSPVAVPCLVDKYTRRHGREQLGKLRKEVHVFPTALFISLIFSLLRIQANKEELAHSLLRRQTPVRTGTFLDSRLGSRRSTARNL